MKVSRMENTRPLCTVCSKYPAKQGRCNKQGVRYYYKECSYCLKLKTETKFKYRTAIPKTSCSRCGFIPEHSCQIDIDHVDGNHSNDDPSNLQALCANCHRLKTHQTKQQLNYQHR